MSPFTREQQTYLSQHTVLLSGPSAAGKSRLQRCLTWRDKDFIPVISYTTRHRRKGEVDGRSYFFVSSPQFADLCHCGEIIETDFYSGKYYGQPKGPYLEAIEFEKYAVVVNSINGLITMRENFSVDPLAVWIDAPDEVLVERMKQRGSTPQEVESRMERAYREREEAVHAGFDLAIINRETEHEAHVIKAYMKHCAPLRSREPYVFEACMEGAGLL